MIRCNAARSVDLSIYDLLSHRIDSIWLMQSHFFLAMILDLGYQKDGKID